MAISEILHRCFGSWWIFGISTFLAGIFTLYLEPKARAPLYTAMLRNGLQAKALDDQFLVWANESSDAFLEKIGVEGRSAYQDYCRKFDFWFPGLFDFLIGASILSLAFPLEGKHSWLNLIAVLIFALGTAERVLYFNMARCFPGISKLALRTGRALTVSRAFLVLCMPMIALYGFIF